MKKMLLIGLTLLMVGCGRTTNEISNKFDLPKELSDCKLFNMTNGFFDIKVMRCPNSTTSTTYPIGKTTATTILVEQDSTIEEMENQIKDIQNKINQMKKEN